MEQALALLKEYYMDLLPFNRVIGIEIDLLDYETAKAVTHFDMADHLVGNPVAGILHGGVTASVIDLTGGLSSLICCIKKHSGKSLDELRKKLASSATIDMRVDYLKPGKGKKFFCESRIVKAGARIVVTKIDLYNEKKIPIAAGTAAYLIA